MSGAQFGLALSVFLACAVEAVEALTIVLAVGVTRDWRSALSGVGVALIVLAALSAGLGPALTALPIDVLRLAVGGLLLVFGLQWLRKAVLRAAGLKALHDETAAFARERAAAEAAEAVAARDAGGPGRGGPGHLDDVPRRSHPQGIDGYAFTVAFKGTLLEGLEVVFIVLTFGANQHDVGLAAVAAGIAVLAVVAAGVAVRAPLARVPENPMKFAVGVMLVSFGMFWGGEGAGAHWPGGDAALLVLIPGTLVTALACVGALRRQARPEVASS
jgi:uncharacterized membrane protein